MKTLIFDLLGVIFPDKAGGSRMNMEAFYESLSEHPISFEVFFARYKALTLGDITSEGFWEGFKYETRSELHRYLDTYNIHENLEEILNELRDDYFVATLSNHPKDWVEYLNLKFKLDEMFEKMYLSETFKLRKPDVNLFKLVCKDLDADPADCYMIDDQNKNLVGAREAGLKTIHMKLFDDPTEFGADFEIGRLDELNEVLKGK